MKKKLIENTEIASVFENLTIGAILIDEAGSIQWANKYFLDTFHFSEDKLIGKPAISILIDPKGREYADFHSFIKGENSFEKQVLEIKANDAEVYIIEIKPFKPIDFEGTLFAGILIGNKKEKKLKKKMLEQLDRKDSKINKLEQEGELSEMKSRFLSIASHEFRTPLAGILSSLNLIDRYLEADQEAGLNFKNREKIKNHITKIHESVKNLTSILTKFLALGNIEQGEIPVKKVSYNLVGALKTQKSHFQQVCKSGQKIIYSHSGNEEFVFLDKNLVKNIMNNLFSNAIKFSDANSVIQLRTEISDDTVQIELEDEGIGIPEAEQNKIFRRFFRAKNSLRTQEGTGLGLSIVKKYVELMDGNITYISKEGKGTSFRILFPNENK